tara:strand:- start:3897 stop:4736 length:840 start_codon:yes stop_codon:yes gene_type:complete
MATLASAVHQAYLTMVHRGHFESNDFHTVLVEADSPDFDVMGVSTNAITILRLVLPEQILEFGVPYEAAVIASAALLVSYKLICESARFWHRQVAIAVLEIVRGEAVQQLTNDKMDADVEAGEAWIVANWNLYALVNDGPYWHFESELSRYHANGQITFFELIGCLSAGAFVHRAAATNPSTDVLEDIASRVGVARLGQALALVTIRALEISCPTECHAEAYEPLVRWAAAALVCNAAHRQMCIRKGGYNPIYQKHALVCNMTSIDTLQTLVGILYANV